MELPVTLLSPEIVEAHDLYCRLVTGRRTSANENTGQKRTPAR